MKPVSNNIWRDICHERYRWAENSYINLLRQVDAERLIQPHADISRQISVIVYGPTQVGKTSLILTLLGVRDDCFKELNQLLRGGQTLGKASTARTYRYRISRDDAWYFSHKDQGTTAWSDGGAADIFASLREEVQAGRRYFDSIDVFIPQRFFHPQQRQNGLLIRDLPGIQAADDNEREYVTQLASQFIRSADVILLTGKADYLGFLKPEELGNDLLADWFWQPHRYKVVLTRTFSNSSIREMLRRVSPDKCWLQAYLFEQINTLELQLPAEMREHIYPLECGHSWQTLIEGGDDYGDYCQRLREQILTDLRHSMLQAVHPLSRLRTGYALPELIIRHRDRLQQQYTELHSTLDKEREYYQRKQQQLSRTLAEYAPHLTKSQTRLDRLQRLRERLNKRQTRNAHQSIAVPPMGARKVSALLKMIAGAREEMALHPALKHLPAHFAAQQINHHAFTAIEQKLHGYHTDNYLFASNYKHDYQETIEAIKQHLKLITTLAANFQRSELERHINEHRRRQQRLQRHATRRDKLLTAVANKLARIIAQQQELTHSHTRDEDHYQQLIGESRRFQELIRMAKNERATLIEQHIMRTDIGQAERLAWVLAARALKKDYEYVRALGE